MTIFSDRLKQYREKLKKDNSKWTQKYVADKIGVARVTYTAYENSTKMPPFDTINSIAELFDIKTDYLMGRTDNPKEATDDGIKELLDDPQTNLMFNDWKNMTTEQREEAIRMIKFIKFKDSNND